MFIKLTLRTTKGNFYLPKLYQLPKLQQRSIKSRFMVEVPLSAAVTSVLKLFYDQTDAANRKSKLFIGAKTKTVQNSNPLAKAIKNLNTRNKVLWFSTFDTSNLFPKIRQYNNHLCRTCLLCRTWNMEEYYIQN